MCPDCPVPVLLHADLPGARSPRASHSAALQGDAPETLSRTKIRLTILDFQENGEVTG